MNASWLIRVRASPWWLLLPKIPCVLAKFQMFGTRCVKRSMIFVMNCRKGYKAHFLMMNLATLLAIFMCWQAQTMTMPPSKNMPTVCSYNYSEWKMLPKLIWSVCKIKKSGLNYPILKLHNLVFLLPRFSKPYNNKTAWQAQVFLKPIQTVFRCVSAVRCTVSMSWNKCRCWWMAPPFNWAMLPRSIVGLANLLNRVCALWAKTALALRCRCVKAEIFWLWVKIWKQNLPVCKKLCL